MLSSIHPLGERSRHNSWLLTVSAFALASTLVGAMVGAAFGFIGSTLLGGVESSLLIVLTGSAAVIAGVLDLARVTPVGTRRQVNENWIGHYRGWVYGGGFGIQLGTGIMTYVVTWGVFATFLAEIVTASAVYGALVGAIFGFGRSMALLAARFIDRPSRLTRFHQVMATIGPDVHRGAAIGILLTGGLVGVVSLI